MAMKARNRVLSLVTSTYVGTQRKQTAYSTTVQIQRLFFGRSNTDADKLLGAYLPASYMESTKTRMEAYTQLARVCTTDDVDDLERQWRDRFGPLPHEVAHLLTVHKIRILATRRNITNVEISGQKLMLTRNNDYILDNKRVPRLQKIKSADKLREALHLLRCM